MNANEVNYNFLFYEEIENCFSYLWVEPEMESIIFISILYSKPTHTSLRRLPPNMLLVPTPSYFISEKDISIEVWYFGTF